MYPVPVNVFKAGRLYLKLKPYLEDLEGRPMSSLIKNWKTTLAGLIGLFVVAGTGMGWLTHNQAQAIGAVAISFGLIAAKDFNVTGTKILIAILFGLVCAPYAVAQAGNAGGATPAFQPSYYVGSGVSFDYYGGSGFAANTEFAAKVTGPVYSYTTIEMTRTQATLRTGAGYLFFQQGNWSLLGLGDAGLATGSGPTLGSFSGGGYVAYDVGSKITKGASHFYVAVGGRLLTITSQTVQPIVSVTFGKGF